MEFTTKRRVTRQNIMGKGQKAIYVSDPLQRLLNRHAGASLSTVVNLVAERYERLLLPTGLGAEWDTLVWLARIAVKAGGQPLTSKEIETLGERIEAIGVSPAARAANIAAAKTYKQLPYPLKLAIVLQAEAGGD